MAASPVTAGKLGPLCSKPGYNGQLSKTGMSCYIACLFAVRALLIQGGCGNATPQVSCLVVQYRWSVFSACSLAPFVHLHVLPHQQNESAKFCRVDFNIAAMLDFNCGGHIYLFCLLHG